MCVCVSVSPHSFACVGLHICHHKLTAVHVFSCASSCKLLITFQWLILCSGAMFAMHSSHCVRPRIPSLVPSVCQSPPLLCVHFYCV